MTAFNRRISPYQRGREGERRALDFLVSRGWVCITTNYRTPYGEIDLVMWDGPTLVFVEVKNRFSNEFGFPSEAVYWRQQRRIVKASLVFIQRSGLLEAPKRFDIVGVMPDSIEHYEGAFISGSSTFL